MLFIYTGFGHLKSTFPISSDWLNPTLYFSEFINSRITWTSVLRKHRKKTPERKGCKDKTGKKKSYKLSASRKIVQYFWQEGQWWILTFCLLDLKIYIVSKLAVPSDCVIQWGTRRNAAFCLLHCALQFQEILGHLSLTFIFSPRKKERKNFVCCLKWLMILHLLSRDKGLAEIHF